MHNARHVVIGPIALSALTLAVVLATLLPSIVGQQVNTAYAIGSKVVLSAFAIAVLTYLGWWERTGFRQLPGRRDAVWLAPPALLVGAMLGAVVVAGPVPMETADAIAFAAVALGTGFSEEALFRGALLEQMRPWGVRRALIGSAVAFALIHFVGVLGGADFGATAAQVFLYAFPWGVAFAGLRLTGRSIWPLVAIHAANNFGGYLTTGAWLNQPADVERFAAAGLLQAALLLTLAAYAAWFIWHPPAGAAGANG